MGPMLLLLSALCGSGLALTSTAVYYGAEIGKIHTNFHEVRGEVYATDEKKLFIRNFNYDGKGLGGVVFWAGTGDRPSSNGFHIPSDRDSDGNLPVIENEDVLLHLPEGMKVTDIDWLSVWTRNYSTNFGAVRIPDSLVPPQPLLVGPLNGTKGAYSGEILILDSQTFVVPSFSYDGSGKDVHWWLSRGNKPNMEGLRVATEESDLPLQEQYNRTVVIALPDGHSVFEYDFLSLWSESENTDYGFVSIPEVLNIPPSPRTLRNTEKSESETNKMNCEMLNDNLGLEVRWLISGNDIILHLVGNLEESEYMALGLSKDDTETKFDSADAAVTWIDENGIGHVVDYFFENTEKCENGHGMCPDEIHKNSRNNLQLLSAIKSENTTIITFKRPLKADEQSYDQNIYTDGPQAVLWAVGPVQDGIFIGPPKLRTRGNLLLDFGRDPNWNCPPPSTKTSNIEKSDFAIRCPSDHLFRAQMGPDNNGRNVWFINGLPAPKLIVKRDTEYTFIVEGGMNPPKRNPLYITSSEEGGFNLKHFMVNDTSEEFFAGVHHDIASGIYLPTSEGRLCQWSLSDSDPENSVSTFESNFTKILTLACEPGNYAKLSWTPNSKTPSTVYYQSFTEKGLGGIIQVVDSCEEVNSRSYLESHPKVTEDKPSNGNNLKSEIEREGSIEQVSSTNSIKTNTYREREDLENKPEKEDIEDSVLHEKDAFENSEKSQPFFEHQPIDYIEHSNSFEKKAFEVVINNNHSNESSEIYDESLMMDEPPRTEISQPLQIDPLHPHDESERSDKNVPQSQNVEVSERAQQNKVPVGSHSGLEKSSSTRQHAPVLHPKNEPLQIRRVPTRFKPQFEGGFVPLVLNPMKEKESSLSHNFDLPPSHLRRPHRPFLFNESIPFHGTFKPGVPDFSGFNISHYSQDDSYPLNHVLDNLSIVSSSIPQLVQRPLNNLPPELFQRHQVGRPQIFGYGPRPKIPEMGYYQQPPVFAQLPNIRVPNSHEELSEVSSQRVQVALQASVDDKGKSRGIPSLPLIRPQDLKNKDKQHSNKLVHAPPIQRRPDFVEGEIPLNGSPYKQTPLNYFPDRLAANMNKNEKPRIPLLQNSGLQTPFGVRRPTGDNGPRRIPHASHGLKAPTNPFIQNPHRDIIPHFHFKQAENPLMQKVPAPNSSSNNKHIHPTGMNPKPAENLKDGKTPDDFDAAPQVNNQERFPLLVNPELMQHPSKHSARPQLFAIRPNSMNIPGLFFQANRPHNPPGFPNNGEIKIKKLPIPLQEPRLKNIPGYIASVPLSSDHSLNDKVDQIDDVKFNDTTEVSENSGYQPVNEKEFENNADHGNEKFEIYPSELLDESENGGGKDTTLQYEDKHNTASSDNIYTTTVADYVDYDVPFGARLKSPPNGGSQRPRPYPHNRKRIPFPRKPQLTSSSPIEENTEKPELFSFYTQPDKEKTNFASPSHPTADSSRLQPEYEKDDELIETDTSNSPTPSPAENKLLNNSNIDKDSIDDTQRHETLFELEKHHGRKHLLPNSSSNSSELLNIKPPKVPQNLTLPQISEKPPTHDNGTDYSILNHVLSLIGGQPDPNISPRHAD